MAIRQGGDDRRFCRRQLGQRLAEVGPRRGLDAVGLVAVVVLVEVGGDDLLLALLAGECLRDPDRLDDLLELALHRPVRILHERLVEQPRADQLLGDRGRPTAVTTDQIESCGDDPDRIEPGVLPEGLVLDRGRGVEQERRDLREGHDLAPELAEAGKLDRAGPVVDDRLLGQLVGRQGRRVGEGRIVGEGVVAGDHGDRPDDPEAGEEDEGDDRDVAERRGPPGRRTVETAVGVRLADGSSMGAGRGQGRWLSGSRAALQHGASRAFWLAPGPVTR